MDTSTIPARQRVLGTLFPILLHWLPMVLWAAWIFWLSDQPKLPHPGRRLGLSDYLFDYAAHAFTFGLLAVLAWWAFISLSSRRVFSLSPRLLGGLFSILYAVSDELHQAFVPGRWAKASDWLADVIGILVALGLIAWIERFPVLKRSKHLG